jgi:hypothetical protein
MHQCTIDSVIILIMRNKEANYVNNCSKLLSSVHILHMQDTYYTIMCMNRSTVVHPTGIKSLES